MMECGGYQTPEVETWLEDGEQGEGGQRERLGPTGHVKDFEVYSKNHRNL